MTAELIVRTVKRYVCPFCHRGHSKRPRAEAHMAECYDNPARRACRSCVHLRRCCGGPSMDCGCRGLPDCVLGVAGAISDELGIAVRFDWRSDCPSWGPAS